MAPTPALVERSLRRYLLALILVDHMSVFGCCPAALCIWVFSNALTMHLSPQIFVYVKLKFGNIIVVYNRSEFILVYCKFGFYYLLAWIPNTPNTDKTRIRVNSERAMSLDRHLEILGSSLKMKVIKVRQIVILFYLRFPRNNFDIVCYAFPWNWIYHFLHKKCKGFCWGYLDNN